MAMGDEKRRSMVVEAGYIFTLALLHAGTVKWPDNTPSLYLGINSFVQPLSDRTYIVAANNGNLTCCKN